MVSIFVFLFDRMRCLRILHSMEGGQLLDRIVNRTTKQYTERDAARYISMIVKAVAHLHSMDIVSTILSQHYRSNLFLFLGSS